MSLGLIAGEYGGEEEEEDDDRTTDFCDSGGEEEKEEEIKAGEVGGDDEEDKEVEVDLFKTWPFTHCRIVLQMEGEEGEEVEGGGDGLKEGWRLEGPHKKFVFYDKVTKGEREELERLRGRPKSKLGNLPQGGRSNPTRSPSPPKLPKREVKVEKGIIHRRRKISPPLKRARAVSRGGDGGKSGGALDMRRVAEAGAEGGVEVEAVFKCPYCLKVFRRGEELIHHLENSSEGINVKVKTEPVEVIDNPPSHHYHDLNPSTSLKVTREIKTEAEAEAEETSGGKRSWPCIICGEVFSRSYDLSSHAIIHTDDKPFKCPLCSERFHKLAFVENHLKVTHGKEEGTSLLELLESRRSRKKKKFPNQSPPDTEGSDSSSDPPRLAQLEPNIVPSSLTDPAIENEGALSEQKRVTKTPSKSTTTTPASLPIVPVRQNGEKRFRCTLCSATFPNRTNARRHLLIHGGERRYGCHLCPKRFLYPDHLKRHLQIHSGLKPHKCPVCQQAFLREQNLRRHILNMHRDMGRGSSSSPERNLDGSLHQSSPRQIGGGSKVRTREGGGQGLFRCAICKTRFTNVKNLKRHVEVVHAPRKRYKCKYCGRRFARSDGLKRHLKNESCHS